MAAARKKTIALRKPVEKKKNTLQCKTPAKKFVKPRKGKHSTVQVLDLKSLSIDPIYQRFMKPAMIKKIVDNFNPVAIGILYIAVRANGSRWVIDGQQRITALIQLGFVNWECEVVYSPGPIWEAQQYIARNDRAGMLPQEIFRGMLAYGEPVTVAVADVVNKSPFELELKSHGGTWPKIVAVGALISEYKRGDSAHLLRVLNILGHGMKGDSQACTRDMIMAVSVLILRCHATEDKRLMNVLGRTPAEQMLLDGKHNKKLTGGSRFLAIAKAMESAYNKRWPESKHINFPI